MSQPNLTLNQQGVCGGLYVEFARGGPIDPNTPSQPQLDANVVNCKCVTSTTLYYGVSLIGKMAVAGPTPIVSRIASLNAGGPNSGSISSAV